MVLEQLGIWEPPFYTTSLLVAALLLVSLSPGPASSQGEVRTDPAGPEELAEAPVEKVPWATLPDGGGVFEKQVHPPTPWQLAERAYREALRLEAGGEEEAARQQLGEALDLAPGHRGARLTLATLLARRGQLGEAKQLLELGLEAEPGQVSLARLQARILVEMDDVEQAVALLERVAPPPPADPDHHAFLAALYQRQGRHDRAAQLYRQVLRLDRRRATWWMGLGISLEAQGRSEEALAAYRGTQRIGGLDPTSRRFVEERIEGLVGALPVKIPAAAPRSPGAG